MRHRCLHVLILILLMVSALLASAPDTQHPGAVDTIGPASMIRPVPEGHSFPHGTVLHYDAEWRLWKAGTATMRIDAAGPEERSGPIRILL
jgi:hypothetical protein